MMFPILARKRSSPVAPIAVAAALLAVLAHAPASSKKVPRPT